MSATETYTIPTAYAAPASVEFGPDELFRLDLPLERVGMEACSLTAWLHDGLTAAGWPAICIETRRATSWGCPWWLSSDTRN